MDYLEHQIDENIYRLQRQMSGIQKKVAMWKEVKDRLGNDRNHRLVTKKIEQLTFFGT